MTPKDEEQKVRNSYHGRVRSEVLDLVPDGSGKVLDVGGGIGASLTYLKAAGKCDYAVVADLVANACLPEVDMAYEGNLEDPQLLEKILQEQGEVDVILGLDVFEHLADPWSIVAACHKMLKPGGVIIASIPNARHYKLVVPLVFQGKFELTESGIMDRTHLRWFVRDTAITLMTSSGLTLEHVRGKMYGKKNNLVNYLTFGIFRNFLYLQYFIRVRRE